MASTSEPSDSEEMNEQAESVLSLFRIRKKVKTERTLTEPQFLKIKESLSCPICLRLFQEPVYIKDCSHRYCKQCIEKHIRLQTKKSCPICRKKIGTRRDLNLDENLISVMQIVFNDVTDYMKEEEKQLQIELTNLNNNLKKNIQPQLPTKIKINSDRNNNTTAITSFTVQLYPKNAFVKQIDKFCLRIPGQTTIEELIIIVCRKLNLESNYFPYLDLFICEELQNLQKTLSQLNKEYWEIQSDFLVYDPNDFHKWPDQEKIIGQRQILYSLDRAFLDADIQ